MKKEMKRALLGASVCAMSLLPLTGCGKEQATQQVSSNPNQIEVDGYDLYYYELGDYGTKTFEPGQHVIKYGQSKSFYYGWTSSFDVPEGYEVIGYTTVANWPLEIYVLSNIETVEVEGVKRKSSGEIEYVLPGTVLEDEYTLRKH